MSRILRSAGAALVLVALNACSALEGAFEPIDLGAKFGSDSRIEVQTLPIALMASDPGAESVGKLQYRGGLFLKSRDERFGGFSGLLVSADGQSLLAVSEGGSWFTADIVSREGRLSALRNGKLAPMLDGEGKPLARREGAARAVTPASDQGLKGPLFVAYERNHRIWRYDFGKDGFAARPQAVDIPAEIPKLTVTGGIQGLFAMDAHTLLALSEDARDKKYDLQGWLIPIPANASARHGVLFLKASGDYKPADVAGLPGGDLFVLERSFSLAHGAAMQIRRIKRNDVQPLAVLNGEIVARLDVRYSIDNMEGLAIRQTPTGEILLYLLSNDNFNGLQRTVLLEFALTGGSPGVAIR